MQRFRQYLPITNPAHSYNTFTKFLLLQLPNRYLKDNISECLRAQLDFPQRVWQILLNIHSLQDFANPKTILVKTCVLPKVFKHFESSHALYTRTLTQLNTF